VIFVFLDYAYFSGTFHAITLIFSLYSFTEAEKVSSVAKILWDQKIMEKESERKMAEIEGRRVFFYFKGGGW